MKKLFKSKTIWAAVAGAIAYLLQAPQIGPAEIATAVSGVLGVAGVRDAYAKKGTL